MKKPMICIEQSNDFPGADMSLKVQGDTMALIKLLHGAMTVNPQLQRLFEVAINTLPMFQDCIDVEIVKDFGGTEQQ
jgi:hypothetical protein